MTKIAFGIISIFFLISCSKGSTQFAQFSGVWEIGQIPRLTNLGDFSWGENPYSNGSLIIDLDARKPFISTEGGGLIAVSVERFDNLIEVNGTFVDGAPTKGTIRIHRIDDNAIWVEDNTGNSIWSLKSGESNKYTRVLQNAPYQPLGLEEGP